MKKKFRKLRNFISKWKPALAMVLIFGVLASIRMFTEENTIESPEDLDISFKLEDIDRDTYMFKNISHILTNFYNDFTKNCIFGDSYRTSNKECFNTTGMGLLAVESMETLLIAGKINEFQNIANFVFKNLDCSHFENVNVRTFWQRYIASFIGVYRLTSERLYLNHAAKCAHRLIDILDNYNYPMPIVNFVNGTASKHGFMKKGVEISDITSGLPELVALHQITGDSFYEFAIMKKLSLIPRNFSAMFYDAFDLDTYETELRQKFIGYRFVDHLTDLILAYQLKQFNFIKLYIEEASEYIKVHDIHLVFQLMYIINVATKNGIKMESTNMSDWEYFTEVYFPPFTFNFDLSRGFEVKLACFDFDTIPLKILHFRNDYHGHNISYYVSKIASEEPKNGCLQPNLKLFYNNITSSNFLGQWIKEGLLFESGLKCKMNQRNHILDIE